MMQQSKLTLISLAVTTCFLLASCGQQHLSQNLKPTSKTTQSEVISNLKGSLAQLSNITYYQLTGIERDEDSSFYEERTEAVGRCSQFNNLEKFVNLKILRLNCEGNY
jgi:uncharacterized protein YgiB involved in biofilm formation